MGEQTLIGIIIQLIVSWILLAVILKKNLLVLGFTPVRVRLVQLMTGFLFTGLLCVLIQMLDASLLDTKWIVNPNVTLMTVVDSFGWNVKSVLFEELIFRGALLYIAIQKLGPKTGMLLSAISFGVYHWFSFGVFGDTFSMIVVFIMTAVTGYVWAYAFHKTNSMALPIGLHLGWNFTYNSVFSSGVIGDQLLIKASEQAQSVQDPNIFVHFLLPNVAVPILAFLLIKLVYGTTPMKENLVGVGE